MQTFEQSMLARQQEELIASEASYAAPTGQCISNQSCRMMVADCESTEPLPSAR